MIHLMFNLVQKSSSMNTDDQEYQKMKERIFRINSKALTDGIFYEQRFNVRKTFFSLFFHGILFLLDK